MEQLNGYVPVSASPSQHQGLPLNLSVMRFRPNLLMMQGRVALGENGKATLHVRALVSMKESSGCSGNQIQVHFYSGECSVPWGDGPDGQTSTGSACLGSATAGTSSQAWEKAVPGQGDRKGNKVKVLKCT